VSVRQDAGVTLIESLVVLAILGLVIAVVVVPVNSYWQRSRLQSAAGDIRNFLQTAYTQSINQHTAITVSLQQDTATGVWTMQLSPEPPAGAIAVHTSYVLPNFVSLAYNPVATAGGWPTLGSVRSLICDSMSRTLCPAGYDSCDAASAVPTPVSNVRTLSITHVSMADGSLTPNTRFDIQVYPIWNVSYKKVLL
jgi:prepilin-type N-terminal cleavage/methylation domain-containing protein